MLSNLQHFDILSNGLSGIVPIEFFQLSLVSRLVHILHLIHHCESVYAVQQ